MVSILFTIISLIVIVYLSIITNDRIKVFQENDTNKRILGIYITQMIDEQDEKNIERMKEITRILQDRFKVKIDMERLDTP